jgi:hypothetical protein
VLFGTIAPGARQDWSFVFGGNGDRGDQNFLPHPLNPNGRLICERIGKDWVPTACGATTPPSSTRDH